MNISEHTSKLRNWLEFKKYAKQTVDNYYSNFYSFLAHFEKKNITHPDRINADMIIEFLSGFKEPATHSGYHSAIKIYYEHVAKVGIEKFKYIERPRRNKKLPIVFSQEEIQKLFNACENTKHKVILALLYSTGMRRQELIDLKWSNIDRSRMIINIIQGKGKKDRQVMLSPSVVPLLEKYHKEYRPKDYVLNGQFPEKNLQYSSASVLQVVKQIASAAGLNKRAYTHLLRHCAFTHMVENGTDINLIQRLAGHSSVKTTNLYTHISHNFISKINSPINQIRL